VIADELAWLIAHEMNCHPRDCIESIETTGVGQCEAVPAEGIDPADVAEALSYLNAMGCLPLGLVVTVRGAT